MYKILLLILILIILIIIFHKDNLSSLNVLDAEIVVARYNETLEWLNDAPFNKYPVIIYNKGKNNNFIKNDKIYKIIDLPNIGKIDHTILYHIINSYDNLKNITIFLPGSINMDSKINRAITVINNVENINDSVILCDQKKFNKNLYNFKLDHVYKTSYSQNENKETDSTMLKSIIRPFGKWYNNFFKDKNTDCITYMGIFAVSKKDILKNSKDFYISLINEVNTHPNPEAGHYIERSWGTIFSPLDPRSKIY